MYVYLLRIYNKVCIHYILNITTAGWAGKKMEKPRSNRKRNTVSPNNPTEEKHISKIDFMCRLSLDDEDAI